MDNGWIEEVMTGLTVDVRLLETLPRSKMEVSCNLEEEDGKGGGEKRKADRGRREGEE